MSDLLRFLRFGGRGAMGIVGSGDDRLGRPDVSWLPPPGVYLETRCGICGRWAATNFHQLDAVVTCRGRCAGVLMDSSGGSASRVSRWPT